MAQFKTLLVIGNNHKSIVEKYSQFREKFKYQLTDAPRLKQDFLTSLKNDIEKLQSNGSISSTDKILENLNDKYNKINNMDDFDFYNEIIQTYGENGLYNPNIQNDDFYFITGECYDELIRKNQNNEAPFADPFILKNGLKVYSAKKCEIDWSIIHQGKKDVYSRIWELCVDGHEPQNDDERMAINCMFNRDEYFSMFVDKNEYIQYSTNFWTYAVATEDKYVYNEKNDVKWVCEFFDRFIDPLDNNTTLSIYQIKIQ